ncbi:hypothetical protein [Ruegeria atlantica]|uniref:hypothetical protein n=1 Tax=Ruegeria atlantica TaxID=81569 RepID=UPI0024944B13|nr:hypothetical protein [Ruegeria atlantica]
MTRTTLEQAFEETLRLRQLVDNEHATEIVPALPQVTDPSEHTFQDFVDAREFLAEAFDGQDAGVVMTLIDNNLIVENSEAASLTSKSPLYALTVDEAKNALEAYWRLASDLTKESADLGVIETQDYPGAELSDDQEAKMVETFSGSDRCMRILDKAVERMEKRQQLAPSL